MEDKLYNLKKFISAYWSYNINKITIEKSLDDLGMFGEDKYEFLIEFSKKFNVNMSNVKFEDYVEPEPTLLMHLDSLYRTLFKRKLTSKFDVKIITIEMLFEALKKGKWDNY